MKYVLGSPKETRGTPVDLRFRDLEWSTDSNEWTEHDSKEGKYLIFWDFSWRFNKFLHRFNVFLSSDFSRANARKKLESGMFRKSCPRNSAMIAFQISFSCASSTKPGCRAEQRCVIYYQWAIYISSKFHAILEIIEVEFVEIARKS